MKIKKLKKIFKKFGASEYLALLALLISIVSIYFTIFYKDHDLTVSLIDSDVPYPRGEISVQLLYHNQGNVYSTIIQDYLIYYQKDDWANTGVIFDKKEHVSQIEYNPVILKPGEQYLRKLKSEVDFNNMSYALGPLNPREKIKVGLVTTYITKKGLRMVEMFPVGYITLDSLNAIDRYKINYGLFNLDSNGGYIGEHYE